MSEGKWKVIDTPLTGRTYVPHPAPDKLALAVEALEFYAGPHYIPNDGPWGLNSTDFGTRARQALAAIKADKEPVALVLNHATGELTTIKAAY